jgi:phytoene synthase
MTNQNYLSIYAKSFNWAGFFLPKQTYQKCSALYDFCRVIDNIADDETTIEFKENEFKKFENNFNNKNINDPNIKNMCNLIDEYNNSLKNIND